MGVHDGSAAKAIQNAAYLFYTYGQLTSAGIGGTTEQKAALQLAVGRRYTIRPLPAPLPEHGSL